MHGSWPDACDACDGHHIAAGPAADLQRLAALEGLPPEPEQEGPTMMGRMARELMLSGQGAAGLQQFKVRRSLGRMPPRRALCCRFLLTIPSF